MTVRELREQLRGVNPDAELVINVEDTIIDTSQYRSVCVVERNAVRASGAISSYVCLTIDGCEEVSDER